MATTYAPTQATRSIVSITRVFDAPRDLVFKAWTEPGQMTKWWGPKGFTTPYCTIELRPGGAYHNCMRSPDGRDFWSKGIYREVVVPQRIVSSDYFSDESGNQVPASRYGMSPDWPAETTLTVTFTDVNGKTRLTVEHDLGTAPTAERDMCEQGWSQTLDKLADYLSRSYSVPDEWDGGL